MLFTIPNIPVGCGGYWCAEGYYLPDFTDFCNDMLLRMGLFKNVLDKKIRENIIPHYKEIRKHDCETKRLHWMCKSFRRM